VYSCTRNTSRKETWIGKPKDLPQLSSVNNAI
jgi:hypothetical protein